MGASTSWALCSNTERVSALHSPIITGTLCLMMPAFSLAIWAKVFPRNCVWSKLIFVITDSIGLMILVQSSLPPNPTSITATSTCCSAKYLKANAVVSSKKEGWSGSKNERSSSTKSMTYCWGIISPLIRILSRKSTRCGEVYKPTFSPVCCNMAAMVCAQLPLPFVPAMWIVLYWLCGWLKCASSMWVVDNPSLYAAPPTCWKSGAELNKYCMVSSYVMMVEHVSVYKKRRASKHCCAC